MKARKCDKLMVFTALFLALAGAVEATKYQAVLGSDAVQKITPEEEGLGPYYVVTFELPSGAQGREIFRAMLEFEMDVSARELMEGYVNESPVVEVFALAQTFGEEFDPEGAERLEDVERNMAVGTSRRVRLDITHFVQDIVKNVRTNHGLVIGSLTGPRDGVFEVKEKDGVRARLTVSYSDK
jgi:hypothetical protein